MNILVVYTANQFLNHSVNYKSVLLGGGRGADDIVCHIEALADKIGCFYN